MENKVIKTIKSRVSCRNYNSKKVPLSKVMQIVECGKMAPSARNRQIANILVLRSKKYVEKLRKLSLETMQRDVYYEANTLVLVYAPREERLAVQDCSCILENMFIAATSLNIDSCWINQTDEILNSPKGVKFKKSLGIEENAFIVGTCILGYCDDKSKLVVKERKEDFIKIL